MVDGKLAAETAADFSELDARGAQDALEDAVSQGEVPKEAPARKRKARKRADNDDVMTAETSAYDADEAGSETELEAPSAAEEKVALDGPGADNSQSVDGKNDPEDAANSGGDGDHEAADEGLVDEGPCDQETMDPETAIEFSAAERAEQLRMLEALLFATSDALDEKQIAERLPFGADIPELTATLQTQYENRGVNLQKIGGRWRFCTAPDVANVLVKERIEPRKLSRAALETLAIIAYHQPCTRADIEDVRGVAVSKGSLDQLMEIGWARLRGRRKDAPGRPVLYGTTPGFLEHFGLTAISDLPGMADLKAAGLLDARLPPGFKVPSPADADEQDEREDEQPEDAVFAEEFISEGDLGDADPSENSDSEAGEILSDGEGLSAEDDTLEDA
ncbi:MAG: SMC-Scp complex subunit ScpB [Pseudomonadota bacterium]